MKHKVKKGTITSGLIITALLAASIIFMLLLYTEKKVLAVEEKVAVCVAACDIPAGTDINDVTVKQYFEIKEIYVSAVPGEACNSLNLLAGKTVICSISKGTVMTGGMLRYSDIGSRGMSEPVLVGFRVEDIYQVTGGILRRGDRVHIYTVDAEGDVVLRWENICIEDSFDNMGVRLANTDEGRATRFNIFLEKAEVEEFYSCLDAGNIRIVRL